MPNHMLFMNFDGSNYIKLCYTLSRFFDYSLALLPQKKIINFCYIGTAANDRLIEKIFFTGFMYFKFGRYIHPTQLSLTKNLSIKKIEEHIQKQDFIFVGGGNTHQMLRIWETKGFTSILNKLKNEDRLPLLAGVSAGGMYPFHSGLSDYLSGRYTPLSCLGWFANSFCPHAESEVERLCEFDNNKTHRRLSAYIAAVKTGKLPSGYAVPNDCMLHFYNDQFVHALSAYQNKNCSFITPEKIDSLETILLTRNNSVYIANQGLQKINHQSLIQNQIFDNYILKPTG